MTSICITSTPSRAQSLDPSRAHRPLYDLTGEWFVIEEEVRTLNLEYLRGCKLAADRLAQDLDRFQRFTFCLFRRLDLPAALESKRPEIEAAMQIEDRERRLATLSSVFWLHRCFHHRERTLNARPWPSTLCPPSPLPYLEEPLPWPSTSKPLPLDLCLSAEALAFKENAKALKPAAPAKR